MPELSAQQAIEVLANQLQVTPDEMETIVLGRCLHGMIASREMMLGVDARTIANLAYPGVMEQYSQLLEKYPAIRSAFEVASSERPASLPAL